MELIYSKWKTILSHTLNSQAEIDLWVNSLVIWKKKEEGTYMKPVEKYDCSSLSITEELFWKTLGADGEPKIFGTLNLSLCDSIMLEFLKEVER